MKLFWFYVSHFYDLPFTSLLDVWCFAMWLFIWGFSRLCPCVSKVIHAELWLHLHFEKLQKSENSLYLRYGRVVPVNCHLVRPSQIRFAFLPVSCGEVMQYFQFSTEKQKMRKEKMSCCFGQKNHRRKSNFVVYEPRNATTVTFAESLRVFACL